MKKAVIVDPIQLAVESAPLIKSATLSPFWSEEKDRVFATRERLPITNPLPTRIATNIIFKIKTGLLIRKLRAG